MIACAALFREIRGAGIDQNDLGSGASGSFSWPAAARYRSSSSIVSDGCRGTIFAIGRSRSRTRISSPSQTAARYALRRFINSATFTERLAYFVAQIAKLVTD